MKQILKDKHLVLALSQLVASYNQIILIIREEKKEEKKRDKYDKTNNYNDLHLVLALPQLVHQLGAALRVLPAIKALQLTGNHVQLLVCVVELRQQRWVVPLPSMIFFFKLRY